jgi:REP element-mobilizing transposase RayT
VITPDVDEKLKEICEQISLRYEIEFLEIGTDSDHVDFLVQSVPMYSPTKIVRTIKSITAKEIFRQMLEVKKQLWGGEFASSGYYISTVGVHHSEEAMKAYVKNQGGSNHSSQPWLF